MNWYKVAGIALSALGMVFTFASDRAKEKCNEEELRQTVKEEVAKQLVEKK